jgi:hypothetical protein
MPIQAEALREYLETYMMNCTYKPDTEVSREQKRAISELFIPRYKKYKTAYVTEKRQINVIFEPVFIKHALLQPTVNGPTQTCSTYSKLGPLDAKNWWAAFGEQDLVSLGGGVFNALDHNHQLKYKKKCEDSKFVRTEEWMFDSGASIHVTPN